GTKHHLTLCFFYFGTSPCVRGVRGVSSILHSSLKAICVTSVKEANLEGISLLVGANFEKANLEEASFKNAILPWENFKKANLKGVNFEGANLAWANFKRTNFMGANLAWTNLKRTNLKEANLAGAYLERANIKRTS
ncbi:pentapeptide repeat-containing protein, partial [Candidatus Parabeggiatoa sp. HSG14]|uniref:pentapeptide repeat-containing protein n=1 Tax=Candidatus Parabeggiatoa sp. HSG14 TaxID=3055593 RepID=UPI0025A88524|nr:pentapeptide repeat-containing protein [Thiotrichales bacterium HSG14]